MINKITTNLARFKVVFSRAGFYFQVFNFALILATFKKAYDIDISAFVLVPIGFMIILTLGTLDYFFILKKESKMINKQNDIKEQLNRIEKSLYRLKFRK